MPGLQRMPLRYKFWAVNALALLCVLILVLVAMTLEQRSVNQARQEQARDLLRIWHGADPGKLSGPLQPLVIEPDEQDPQLRQLAQSANSEPRWVPVSGSMLWGEEQLIGAWTLYQPDAQVLAVQVRGKSFQQIFTQRAGLYALAVFLLMLAVLAGSQLLIRFIEGHQRQLRRMAHYDGLTGLPNRVLAMNRLQHALERIKRRGGHLAVVFIDLDRFKTINDSYGHGFGDAVLQAVAERLQSRCREEDTLSRLGGDEFLLILESLSSPWQASQVARDLLSLLERPLLLADEREVYVSASLGIALFPGDGLDATELVRNADAAMFRAKSRGRNTYSHYLPCLTEQARERFELERALRTALANGELSLNYQPLVSLEHGQGLGAEVLLSWHSPSHGQVPPARFIPLAEDSGLIVPIGSWVLNQACQQAQQWRSQGLELETLAVNLSPVQFLHQDIVALVGAALESSGLPAQHLELEITEGALMHHSAQAEQTLKALKALGVRVALDDFGTGYSSLAYLRRFPLDKLKIDKSFLTEVPANQGDCQLVHTIIELAHNLGLRVLAEGIERSEQWHWLQTQHCELGQGFLFARPMPAEAFANWWAAQPLSATPQPVS